MNFPQFQSAFLDGGFQFVIAIHLAVAICDACKVERCRLQGICRCFETLPVSNRLEYIDVRIGVYRTKNFFRDFGNLGKREAIQELAHPNAIGSARKLGLLVENIAGNRADAAFKTRILCVFPGDCGLPRKIDDGNVNVRIVLAAGDGPFRRVAADVEKLSAGS